VVQKLDDEKEIKDRIGSSIVVAGVKFNIVYDGMERYCYLCSRKHGNDCPTRARFEFLKKLRKGRTTKRKFYSDSIMRHVNSLALVTDVAVMSGGGIGQIVNAIHHDQKHEEVIINAGTNEIIYSKTPDEYVYTIEKSLEKLQKLTEE